MDRERQRRPGRSDERHLVGADRYVHPAIGGGDAVSSLRAPTDAATRPASAPSSSHPDNPPAADEEPMLSTIDIDGLGTTSCRGRLNRC